MSPLEPGDPRRLGEYDLVRRLGEGGQGVVFLGIGPGGGRVAVKQLKGYTDPATQRRLVREFEAVKRVNPFCTAQVISFEESFIVSEFVDGPSLQQRVQQSGPLAGGELIRLAIGTASALAAIHDAGVVHRDFKPANVLLGPDGPRVVDFGIARPIDAGSSSTAAFGTPGYIAPELLRGEPISAKSDLFAWAATIVFAATGRHPFAAETVALIYQRILAVDPDVSAIPADLQPTILACLSKNPEERPDANAVMNGLVAPQRAGARVVPQARSVRATTPEPLPVLPSTQGRPGDHEFTVPPPPLPRSLQPRRKPRARFVLAGAGALAALVLAGFFLLPLDGKNKGKDDIKPSVTPTASAATGVPAAYAGTWKGTVTDTNGGSFSLNLTLNAGTETGRFVASGGSNCNQPVNYRSTSGTTLTLRLEESTDPPCSAGTVTVTLNGSTLAYRYQDASVSATATLTK